MSHQFLIRRFIKDYTAIEREHVLAEPPSMAYPHDLASYFSSKRPASELNKQAVIRELELWMDVTVDEMVLSFRKVGMDVKTGLLFLKENQDRYFERSHLVRCEERHVVGTFPLNDGIDGGKSYCPYCEKNVPMPKKTHQQVVYNWK